MESSCNLKVQVYGGRDFLGVQLGMQLVLKVMENALFSAVKIIKWFLTLKTYILRMCRSSRLKRMESWQIS